MNFYSNNFIKFSHKIDLNGDYSRINKIILTFTRSFVKTHLFKRFNIENRTAFVNNSNITGKEVMLYGI